MREKCCMCGKEIESGWKSGFEYLCEEQECIDEWFVMEFTRYEPDYDEKKNEHEQTERN